MDSLLMRNEKVLQEAIQKWFAFTVKQVQTDLRTKFKKDITSELTDWDFIEEQGKKIIKPATLSVMQSGGDGAYKMFQVKGAFDVLNVDAVRAADKFTAKLVKGVNAETKKGIRKHISNGVKAGKGMPKIAKELRPLVGLTSRQTQSVGNYRNLLGNKEKFPGLSDSDIDRKVGRYADKTHRRRTQTIARTETARAQNIGYAQGMDDLGVMQLQFSATIDEHTSATCTELNGRKYDVGEAKNIIPVHPNCRCAMLPVLAGKAVDSVAQMAEALPSHIGDLVTRWEGALSRSNKWVLKDKLRKLGHNTDGSPIGLKPPIIPTPTITPPPVTGLPQNVQDLVTRWQSATSRSSKWSYQNKLKQLGYDVKTRLYKPTGITPKPIPKPKPKAPEGVLPRSEFNTTTDWDKHLVSHKQSLKERIGVDLETLSTRPGAPGYEEALTKFEKAIKSYTKPTVDTSMAAKSTSVDVAELSTRLQEPVKNSVTNGSKKYLSTLDDIGCDDILNVYNKNYHTMEIHSRHTRANARPKLFETNFGADVTHTEIFHEMGHLLESHEALRLKANRWVRARGKDKKIPYNKICTWSKDKELGYKDKFIDPYVGKIYGDGHTEAISMGMQNFTSYKKMLSFAKRDFDHFSFIHGILTGAI